MNAEAKEGYYFHICIVSFKAMMCLIGELSNMPKSRISNMPKSRTWCGELDPAVPPTPTVGKNCDLLLDNGSW